MNHFDYSAQFKNEFKRLFKKYRSLEKDLKRLEILLGCYPLGKGASFALLHKQNGICIIKARLACESLRAKSLRVIYAFVEGEEKIEFIELYFKGDKEREDETRIENYLRVL